MRRLGIAFGWSGLLALVSIGIVAPHASATFPGRNGLIAFDAGYHSQIYTVRPDGSNIRQLTHVPKGVNASAPKWSPDGRRIAYCVDASDCEAKFAVDARIWVMNWDGSGQHKVVDDPAYSDADPSWSPDGRHIVFSRCSHVFGTCDIDVMRADGTHIRTLIGGYWHHIQPVYSPDGTRIAFASDKGGFDERVWIADANGSHLRVITPARLLGAGPAWAPDGSRIVFAGPVVSSTSQIWTVAPDGSDLHLLAPGIVGYSASYSPNSRKIVVPDFSGNLPGCDCSGWVLVNPDGTGLVPIVTSKQVALVEGGIDWGVAR